MEDFIDFEKIRASLKLDQILLTVYLKEIYKDLADREGENKKSGITKITFFDYVKMQVFIAEKLFYTMDKDNDGFLNLKEFSEGMTCLYSGTFEDTSKFIFDLYDFDKDGKIISGDVKVVLSYLPLKNNLNISEYNYQMDSLQEIDDILKKTFNDKSSLSYHEFMKIIENKKSDIYLQLLFFLYEKRPFNDQNINVYKNSPKKIKIDLFDKSSPTNKIKNIPSPSKKTLLSPVCNYMKIFNLAEDCSFEENKILSSKPPEISGQNGMIRMDNTLVSKDKKKNLPIDKIIK